MKSSTEQLRQLAPLAGLSPERLAELAEIAHIEHVARGADPLAGRPAPQSVFLLAGEMLLFFQGGGTLVVVEPGANWSPRQSSHDRGDGRGELTAHSPCACHVADQAQSADRIRLPGRKREQHRADLVVDLPPAGLPAQ